MADFFDDLKKYIKSPRMLLLGVLLALMVSMVIADLTYLPALSKVFSIISVLGVAVFLFLNTTRTVATGAELRFDKRELYSIIQNLKDGILIYDPNFKIMNMNRAAEEIFGVSAEEVVGKRIEPGMVKILRYRV